MCVTVHANLGTHTHTISCLSLHACARASFMYATTCTTLPIVCLAAYSLACTSLPNRVLDCLLACMPPRLCAYMLHACCTLPCHRAHACLPKLHTLLLFNAHWATSHVVPCPALLYHSTQRTTCLPSCNLPWCMQACTYLGLCIAHCVLECFPTRLHLAKHLPACYLAYAQPYVAACS